jgi:hypothetical protein
LGTASTPAVAGDGSYSITDGFFRVKRLEDNALPYDQHLNCFGFRRSASQLTPG